MRKTSVEFAWAMPVNIVTFGAYLEAYVKLQPTFDTLRLCNRFGRGENAAITKLPIELAQHVETYLLQDQRETIHPQWVEDFKCWEDHCTPIDHLTDEDILDTYNECMQDMPPSDDEYEEGGCICCVIKRRMASEVTDEVKEFVEEIVTEAWPECEGYQEVHRDNISNWFKRVGAPSEASRGCLDKFSDILKRHFGLQVWISHVQEDRERPYSMSNITHSTKAYMRLPEISSTKSDWEHRFDDWEFDPRRKPTEAGFASAHTIPPTPTDKSLARFTRAIKILGLTKSQENLSKKLTPSDEDQEEEDEPGEKEGKSSGDSVAIKAQLTMLVRNNDDEEDFY